jgi:hypothetical protein
METDRAGILKALEALVKKYSPEHKGLPFPENELAATGVTAVEITGMTGKFHL